LKHLKNKKAMAKNAKHIEYAALIVSCIDQMFEEDNDFSLDKDEMAEGENLTEFIHALANIVPNHYYNKVTGDNKAQLQFNHLANHLCFQYGTVKEE